VIAATADTRVHCVLKNCVIWFLYTQNKGDWPTLTGARGPQCSLYGAIFPIIVVNSAKDRVKSVKFG